MKKFLSFIIASTVVLLAMGDPSGEKMETKKGNVEMFQSVNPAQATLLQEGANKLYCPLCGMTLPMFYKTNHAATHKGHTKQYCSIHCLADDNAKRPNELSKMKVVDVTTLQFIDATKAFYVVGSSKQGTMSMVSKYAFGSKEAAEAFAKEFGGELKSFEEAFKIATDGVAKTNAMIEQKRIMMAKKGKQAYAKFCKSTTQKFDSIADAKAYIEQNKLCGELQGPMLQAIALYLVSQK